MFLPCHSSRDHGAARFVQDGSSQDSLLRGERAAHEIECVPRYLRIPGELLVTVSQEDPRLLNLYTPRLELRKIHFRDERREVWEKSIFPRFVPDDATPQLSIDGVELPRDTPYADPSEFWCDLCLLFAPDCIISTARALQPLATTVRRRARVCVKRKLLLRPRTEGAGPGKKKRRKPLRSLSDLLSHALPPTRLPGCPTAHTSGSSCAP